MNTASDVHPSVKAMRSTTLGIWLGVFLVFVKLTAGYFGHSYALVADAMETCTDVLSSVLLWIGLRLSMKPADKEHPYGHGKAEPLVAVFIALFLFVAAIFIAWNAIVLIRTPHQLPKIFTLLVLVVVMAIKEGMYHYTLRIGNEINSQAVRSDAAHHRSDALTSVAAFIGISVALILGKGYESADDWAALIAAGIISINAFSLLRPALNEVMDAAPSNEIVLKVRALASENKEVLLVEKCYVRKMGFDYFVDLHIQVDGSLSVIKGHSISHEVKARLLNSELRIKNVLVHVEPLEE